MSYRFVRTAAGQSEIHSRALKLHRPVRNLLLIINADAPADHWLSQVSGCTEADLFRLVAEGLIEPAAEPQLRTAAEASATYLALQQRVRQMSYATLYNVLNGCAKQMLGLVAGYRFALEVEKCTGPQELQGLALQFLERLRAQQGMVAAANFGHLLDAH